MRPDAYRALLERARNRGLAAQPEREMMVRAEEARTKEARGEGYVEMPDIFMPALGASLFVHNVEVAFLVFAGGLLAGLGTAAVLVSNGVFFGAVAGLFANMGASLHLWTFVLSHGIIEGFVSPSPRALKLALTALFAALLVAYLGLAGRGEAGRRAAEEADA